MLFKEFLREKPIVHSFFAVWSRDAGNWIIPPIRQLDPPEFAESLRIQTSLLKKPPELNALSFVVVARSSGIPQKIVVNWVDQAAFLF